MDELAAYNKDRWEALARANVAWSRPLANLDETTARSFLDPHGLLGDCRDKKVLCLAGGGGQQSAAFGLLGAKVTVLDLAETQIARDRETAALHGLDIRVEQGDMRSLNRFRPGSFDIVWQPFSINFVPEAAPVFQEVARVISPGGRYYVEAANPFSFYSVDETAWDGSSYPLRFPYLDGQEITQLDPDWAYWDVENAEGETVKIQGPREFRHSLSTLINGLTEHGFVIQGLWEEQSGDPNPDPGTWEHYKKYVPPWFKIWTRFLPNTFA